MIAQPEPPAESPAAPRWRIADWLWVSVLVACLMTWARYFHLLFPNTLKLATDKARVGEAAFALTLGLIVFAAVRSLAPVRLERWLRTPRTWPRRIVPYLCLCVPSCALGFSTSLLEGLGFGEARQVTGCAMGLGGLVGLLALRTAGYFRPPAASRGTSQAPRWIPPPPGPA